MVYLATGLGKTVCFGEFVREEALQERKSLIVVRSRDITIQTYNRIKENHYPHCGIFISKVDEKIDAPIVVASIDTILSRLHKVDENGNPVLEWMKDFHNIIVDECHLATTDGFGNFFEFMGKKKVIGFTATPFIIANKRHEKWKAVIHTITMKQAIDRGYLVPPLPYCPSEISTANLATSYSTGDFNIEDLFKACNTKEITGDVISHYKELGQGRVALCFAVNVVHSVALAAAFRANGIEAVHCDADTSDEERARTIEKLKEYKAQGKPFIICNVNIFTTGVDIPEVDCLIMARPTMSLIYFYQTIGRGLRTYSGKKEVIVIDHGGNFNRLGCITLERDIEVGPNAEKGSAKDRKKKKKYVTCPYCFYALVPKRAVLCPSCGVFFKSLTPDVISKSLTAYDEHDMIFKKFRILQVEAQKFRWSDLKVYKMLYKNYKGVIFEDEVNLILGISEEQKAKILAWAKKPKDFKFYGKKAYGT